MIGFTQVRRVWDEKVNAGGGETDRKKRKPRIGSKYMEI